MSDPLERAVIGLALTADPAVAIDLGDVRPEHFADLRHAALWDLIARMWANEAVTDPMTVVANLSSIPADERRGVDDDYLLECLASAPVPADLLAHEYAFRLIQAAEHQRLTAALIRAQQLLEGTPDPVEAESLIRSTIDAAAPKSRDAGVALADAVAETVPTLGQATTFTATPWADLNNLIGGWRKGGLYVVGARPGVGKALSLDTPLPTPTGWTTMGDVKVGDEVLGMDGKPTRVTFATEVQVNHQCYELTFSDGAKIVADADHRWLVEDRASRKASAAAKHAPHTSKYASQQRRCFPRVATTEEIAATVRCKDGRANYSLPSMAPLDLPESNLPLDPYVFGYWLGDGDARTATVTTWNQDTSHFIEALDRAGYHYSFHESQESCARITFSTTPIRRGGPVRDSAVGRLREMGVLRSKHIPRTYLRASYGQRLDLLRGLLDSDGTVSKSGQMEYTTVDEPLANDVMELMRTLGLRPTFGTRQVRGRDVAHSTDYRIHAMATSEHMTLARKAKRLPDERRNLRRYVTDVVPVASVPVRCIQVSNNDHMYLAGEAMVPTHNTLLGLNAAAGLARTGPVALSTLEMNRREVSVRLLAAAGRINVGHLTGVHDMTDADWLKVPDAQALVSSLPISVDDRTGATVWDVVTHARLLARSGPLAAVVVDYLQLLTTPRGDQRPRHEIVSDQSRQLKVLAGELDCPVIALSQLNRQSEGRAGGTPMLSDLRESGSLEQDADVVMLLNMPMVDDGYGGEAPDTGRLDVIVAKNRQGEVGTVRLQRDGATATLRNLVNSWQAR